MVSNRNVHVVDDNSDLRRSIQLLLSTAGLTVKCFASANDFLEQAHELDPGIALIDIRMPGMDGIQLLEAINDKYRKFSCVMITGHGEIDVAVEAIKKGARDFLEKPFREEALFTILDREFKLLNEALERRRASEEVQSRLARLTQRERQVLRGLVQGKANKLMAHELGISVRTVEMHRASLMDRLACRSLAEAVSLAISNGEAVSGVKLEEL